MQRKLVILTLIAFFVSSTLQAQGRLDTMDLRLPDAEKMFLDSNLQLLAQRYNVDANRALVIQARLWPNPNFSAGHALYSGALKQFFPLGVNDETTFGLSQLILLAGKRNKQVKLARANAVLTEYQFFDLLRTLKYTLRTDFFNIHYLQQSAKLYDAEIGALQQIVTAFESQQGKGYISQKEVIRIRAQLYSFQAEHNGLMNQINDVQSELRLLLQVKPGIYIVPLADSTVINGLDPGKYSLTTLIDSAFRNRTDLQIARTNTNISKLNYDYQRSLAVPDLSLSLGYDEQGSFLTSYYGIGASIDLPVFNRNQGNIKSAKAIIGMNSATQKNTEATVQENVSRSLQKAFDQDKLFKAID